jgi:hypothetical protein
MGHGQIRSLRTSINTVPMEKLPPSTRRNTISISPNNAEVFVPGAPSNIGFAGIKERTARTSL